MFVVSQLLWAFVGIHAFWLYCFVTGTLVRGRSPRPYFDQAPTKARHYMAELVITSTTGIAITGFVLLLLGLAGFLNVIALALWLALEILLFKIIRRENVFASAFWRNRLQTIKQAWAWPTLTIYLVFLILLVPAILPPTSWDSISYHLAYAVDWAHAGRIYADEFLRFPYYANNFVLIYALMFVLKLGLLCHLTTWLCGLLSGLGVYVLVSGEATLPPNASRWFRFAIACKDMVLPLTLALSPAFMKYVNVGYIDVPIGLFIFIPVLCTYLILKGDARNYEIDLVLTAAFCAGMKLTLFLYLPLFCLSLVLALRRQKKGKARVLTLAALLLALSAPWYVRNFVAVGDPVPPTLNLMLRGRDQIFTAGDYQGLKNDLSARQEPSATVLVPLTQFWSPNSATPGEPGHNLSVLLLYLPIATLCLLLFKGFRKRVGAGFVYLNVAVIYLLIYWAGISALARYFLQLFPVYLGYLGVCFSLAINYVQSIAEKKSVMATVLQTSLLLLLLALPVPGPASKQFYGSTFKRNYLHLADRLRSREDFLRTYLPGYVSTQTIINGWYPNAFQHQRVLVVGFESMSFYFREHDVVSMGDWFGPGRYGDLMAAVDNSELAEYLTRFEIGAVLVNHAHNPLSEEQYRSFVRQLELSRFRLQPRVEARTAVYLKN